MEHHSVSDKICLWQILLKGNLVLVMREVIVTISEVSDNLGLPQSLRAVDPSTGYVYIKTTETMSLNRGLHRFHRWSHEKDRWSSIEAVAVYNAHISTFEGSTGYKLLHKQTREEILPKGDVSYCKEHDQYVYARNECLLCVTSLQRV